jgi:8-oxo-dGTP pyrophosphatase MutT (NUDIX family)
MDKNPSNSIRAAGGIICGVGKNSGKIAVVRRKRYGGEVGLPKGKLNEGESEIEAARREIEEETGLRPSVQKIVGTTRYSVGGRAKSVTYFMMEATDDAPASPRDTGEIQAVEWLTPVEALAALTHENDRQLVATAFNISEKYG